VAADKPNAADLVRRHLIASREVVATTLADEAIIAAMAAISQRMEETLRAGGKILLAGNGGSAADAQHISGELLSRLMFDRSPLPSFALTADQAVLTAIGNDYGYDETFARQVRGLGRKGDVFIAISTSGSSPNILKAVEAANELGLHTVAFTGNRNTPLAGMCEFALRIPSPVTPLIQQVYMAAAHAICEYVEAALFGDGSRS
jgi:D-sedoheptulose 7-phosphate isomerase